MASADGGIESKTSFVQNTSVGGKNIYFLNTVKPELTATSEQLPPVNNGRYNLVTASIKNIIISFHVITRKKH